MNRREKAREGIEQWNEGMRVAFSVLPNRRGLQNRYGRRDATGDKTR